MTRAACTHRGDTQRAAVHAFEVAFEYTQPNVVVSLVSPTSGPVHGMTQLVVHASGLRHGAHYCCRLSIPPDGVVTPFALASTPGIVIPANFASKGSITRDPWSREPGAPSTPVPSTTDAVTCATPDGDLPDMTNQTLTSAAATASLSRQGLSLYVTVLTNCQQYAAPSESVRFRYFGSSQKIPQPAGQPLATLPFHTISPSSGRALARPM